jgi:hypothetical protein
MHSLKLLSLLLLLSFSSSPSSSDGVSHRLRFLVDCVGLVMRESFRIHPVSLIDQAPASARIRHEVAILRRPHRQEHSCFYSGAASKTKPVQVLGQQGNPTFAPPHQK